MSGERESRAVLAPAPSLRVPVTVRNREFLRWLRAAEASAWESGRPAVLNFPPTGIPDAARTLLQVPPTSEP